MRTNRRCVRFSRHYILTREVASPEDDSTEVVPTPDIECDGEWTPGVDYTAGQILCYNGARYIVIQDHTAQEHQAPDDEGMLAIYKPYQGAELCEWLYGEYIEQGWQRTYDGNTYECIADGAVANIYSPDVAESVWKLI